MALWLQLLRRNRAPGPQTDLGLTTESTKRRGGLSTDQLCPAFPNARLVPLGEYLGKPQPLVGHVMMLLGSGSEAHLRLRSGSVSRRHALLHNADGHVVIRDLGSRTRTLVNGHPVSQATLRDGDHIRIGRVEFKLDLRAPAQRVNPTVALPARLRLESDQTGALT